MSLLLITKRGTSKRVSDEEINYNWAGSEFKNFQEERKTTILFKRKKTIISSTNFFCVPLFLISNKLISFYLFLTLTNKS